MDKSRISQISDLNKRFSSFEDNELYYAAMDFIAPRSCLLHVLEYRES